MRPARLFHSFAFRIAVLHAALSVGSVVVLLGFLYWATAGYMDRETDATIEAEIQGLAEQYRQRGLVGLTSIIAERSAQAGDGIYLLSDARGAPLVGNLDHWPKAAGDHVGWVGFRIEQSGRGDRDTTPTRARVFVLPRGLRLLVGRDVGDLEATRVLLLDALAWGLGITVALALGGGLMMSRRVVRRIEAINDTSREIMEGDLARRIPQDGSGDDFDQLAANLNRMLARIEGLMAAVRQVSDDIAHDMRTPLTRLRNRLEEARAAPGDSAHRAEVIEQAAADVDDLLTTFNALLRIARIEAGRARGMSGPVDLSALLEDLGELYEPVAGERGLALSVQSPPGVRVPGDRDLLFQALANLVDNAVKYAPAGASIHIGLRRGEEAATVVVADTGPGIPAELHEKVFQRFFRVDDSRATPGSGLGLSLVRAIAHLHGGTVTLEDNAPGLRVLLRLPWGSMRAEVNPRLPTP
ncbi:signal transduction histidine kinase [Thioflavicoccus mobilis 8321]|uniref:histidine kinase n=1 Tax=Thioflavicoccus mobilis 8321 TaxID=765912 RepID=L0H3P7_9GAMM|nr:HAMP domain-containing sensor histidine kinase [Thioflavicoccus mobilis]AGA92214.1 signal transduction histidine kinase [Thioflavicoccus mobilis 8321]